ncbi:flagellar assembly protein FliW [Microaerobacter geothermalis]|uniref:flagellar assembly protein FliW n=1 Tax=Microaerobacter geothermalis TaxID=674972 RepID=UPI001F2A8E29|nr:flagellar assembly protein FliW [Microaerobacter geothermalis]MCF6093419.1 flagellar assembly protein FliW [Microaerobacter geothermalis]
MLIQTSMFGEMTIEENDIILFPEGIPGFLEEKQFVIIPISEESPFLVLQSITSKEVTFVMINPFLFYPNYDITLPESAVSLLRLKKPEEALVYSIVVVKQPLNQSTVNLQAPIIIHPSEKLGKQVVLNDPRYQVKTPLILPQRKVSNG